MYGLKYLLGLLALLVGLSPNAPIQEEPTLREVEIVFHTTRDDKDHNTKLFTKVKVENEIIAELLGFAAPNCRFDNDSTSQSFALKKVARVPKSLIKNGVKAWVKMETVGDDNWWFYFTLTFTFSDGSRVEMQASETRFDDDERTQQWWDLTP